MKRTAIAILAAALALTGCTSVVDAQKNGTMTKLAQQGVFVSTWEAELVRGGSFTGGTGVQGAPFDFTINDPALLAKARDAFDNQKEVRIKYHKKTLCWYSHSGCNFLDSIEVVSETQGGTMARGPQPQEPVSVGVVGVGTDTIEATLKQNQQALNQNERLLRIVEQQVGIKAAAAK